MTRSFRLAVSLVVVLVTPCVVSAQRIDTWDKATGALDLSGEWRRYPGSSATPLKSPPIVIVDDGHRVLRIETDHESVAIWRNVQIGLRSSRHLAWEWKVLQLPEGGDVRVAERNDQAARLMVLFEGMRAIIYVWDTTAPVGTVVRPEHLSLLNQVLVVVRSGSRDVGSWQRERRNVQEDYRRLFDQPPPRVKAIGLESHSDDVSSRSAVEFGPIGFHRR